VDLYTSAVGDNKARFDVYFYSKESTLYGHILEVKRGTSLYDVIAARYREAMRQSRPLWRIWWLEAAFGLAKQAIFPVLLIGVGVGLASLEHPVAIAGSTLSLGIIASVIAVKLWSRGALRRLNGG
jgi:hypothetical protein